MISEGRLARIEQTLAVIDEALVEVRERLERLDRLTTRIAERLAYNDGYQAMREKIAHRAGFEEGVDHAKHAR